MNLSTIKNLSKKSKFTVLGAVVLAFGVVLTIVAAQQNQENRSKAAELTQQLYTAPLLTQPTEPEVVPGEVLIKLKSSALSLVPNQISAAKPGIESLRQTNSIVGAKILKRVFDSSSALPQDQSIKSWYKVNIATNSGTLRPLSRSKNFTEFNQVMNLVDQYKKDPNVEIAEPNYIVHATATPNDTYYATHRVLANYYDEWGLLKINAPTAWNYTTGNNIVVAVIDSGVDPNNPDLQGNMTNGWNFVSNNGNPNDDFGHGTFVAGIIGAIGNNSYAIPGINWHVKIMPVKVLDNTGNGSFANIANGLRYAADNGAKISNNSYAGAGVSQILNDAVSYEYNHGMTIVAAAGNNNQDVSGFSPANTPQAIAVGATDENDQKASFSNYGSKIDVVAPGVDIISITSNVSPLCGITSGGNNYVCKSNGTSFSTPYVAGLAALMLSKNSGLTNGNILQIIRSTAQDLGSAGKDNTFGYGRIDAGRAMAQVVGVPAPTSIPPAPSSSSIPVYRLRNNIEHFFTDSAVERDTAVSHGYVSEGVGFLAFASQVGGSSPVYRLNNSTEHFYTASLTERNSAVSLGYSYENIAFYAYTFQVSGSIPVYRLNNGHVHFYTTSIAEANSATGYKIEGIAFYVPKQ